VQWATFKNATFPRDSLEIEREGSRESITSITYGKVPPGFREQNPAPPLADGESCLLWVHTGMPEASPVELRFTVGKASGGQ
jgi:hypothetical protein